MVEPYTSGGAKLRVPENGVPRRTETTGSYMELLVVVVDGHQFNHSDPDVEDQQVLF
jgi:hypothetical protein